MYVRNRARPEGCIAKGALMEECMTFCARYLKDIETKSTRPDRNYSGEDNLGSHFGIEAPFFLDHMSMEQAHRYLLASTDAIAPYKEYVKSCHYINTIIDELSVILTIVHILLYRRHLRSLQKLAPRDRQRLHNKEFPSWFRADVRVKYQNISHKPLFSFYGLILFILMIIGIKTSCRKEGINDRSHRHGNGSDKYG